MKNGNVVQDTTQLVEELTGKLEAMGYSGATITRLNSIWRNLIPYANENASGAFSMEMAREFIQSHYGYRLDDPDASHNIHRAIHLLSDFQRYGTVFKQSHATLKGFTKSFRHVFEGFLQHLSDQGVAPGSVRTWRSRLFRLEHFLIHRGVEDFRFIRIQHINSYIESLAGFSSSTVGSTLRILRQLFQYAFSKGFHVDSFDKVIPTVRRQKRQRLPTVFVASETEKILSAIDRSNALGKRNYAIFLLLARMGLRISDVRALMFHQFDWSRNVISIIQQKTKRPLDLPIMDEVGWAIIDYLRNGRPHSDCQQIFIKHIAPFDGLTSAFHRPMIQYLRRAGIHVPANKPRGVHSLRHSLATTLLQKQVPIQTISHTLGHLDIGSTNGYVQVNLPQLRLCALEVA
ncbi:tyrosine-type recombinase/integrase [Pseudomonas aeruginosa]|nr:tyrosine-type recombinase/integrase [Pseudomonas aeruginosa]